MAIHTYAYYRQMAQALVVEFGFGQPPIDVRALAKRLGIEIMEMTFPNWFFGVLVNLDGDFYMALNKAMPEHRKSFTIAHEIAHHQLHSSELAYMNSLKRDHFDREADVFAAEVCMPSFMVKDLAAKWYNDYRFLAKLFGTSETAMVKKMQELKLLKAGLYDCKN